MKITLFLAGLLLIFCFACQKQTSNLSNPKSETPQQMHIEEPLRSLRKQMIDYIELGQPDHSEKDVDTCIQLLSTFLSDIAQSKNKEDGMKMVKEVVLKLNDLNSACNYGLLETGEREQICSIIISAGHQKGYNEKDEDITEEWREW